MIVPSYHDGASDASLHRAASTASTASTRSLPVLPSRKMPPPYTPHSNVYGGAGANTGTSRSANVLRKPAPPIPNKKPSLVGRTTLGEPDRYRDDVDADDEPRRSRAAPPLKMGRKPVPNLIDDDVGAPPPPLPPRRGGGGGGGGAGVNLLDDDADAFAALGYEYGSGSVPRPVDAEGWEVLRPGR